MTIKVVTNIISNIGINGTIGEGYQYTEYRYSNISLKAGDKFIKGINDSAPFVVDPNGLIINKSIIAQVSIDLSEEEKNNAITTNLLGYYRDALLQ